MKYFQGKFQDNNIFKTTFNKLSTQQLIQASFTQKCFEQRSESS